MTSQCWSANGTQNAGRDADGRGLDSRLRDGHSRGGVHLFTTPFHVADLQDIVKEAAQADGGDLGTGSSGATLGNGLGRSRIALAGPSEALRAVLETVECLAGNRSTVLITGDRDRKGRRRQVAARSSGMAARPFVAIKGRNLFDGG